MSQAFINFLQQNAFQPDQATAINKQSKYVSLETDTVLVHQGDITEHVYFLQEGLCHACYLTDEGKKYSKEFYWTGDLVVNFESLIQQTPTPYLIESLSQCQLIRLPINQVQQWRDQRHSCYLRLIERQLLHKENKERFMLLHGPEERYRLFNERFPELETRLADYQIASYIGITPVSLSRIKKRQAS